MVTGETMTQCETWPSRWYNNHYTTGALDGLGLGWLDPYLRDVIRHACQGRCSPTPSAIMVKCPTPGVDVWLGCSSITGQGLGWSRCKPLESRFAWMGDPGYTWGGCDI
jgi:hypothetical protein